MTRLSQLLITGSVATGVLLLAGSAEGQVRLQAGKAADTKVQRVQVAIPGVQRMQVVVSPGQPATTLYPGIPGYYLLRMEHVQRELGFSEEQKQKLDQITKQYYEDSRQDWSGLRDLSPEERQKKMADIREKTTKRMEALRKQTEELLLPHQLKQLKEIDFRMRAPAALANPRTLEQLGATEEQKEQLRLLREQTQEKTRQLQQEMVEKALQVLTPGQQEKLREMSTPGFKIK